jgi:Uma2 family endonuclease
MVVKDVQVTPTRKMWTADEYELIVEKGILSEDERVELIQGEIVKMAPIGPRHAMCVRRLDSLFIHLLGNAVIVSGQSPVRLGNNSEPEPDVALLKYREDEYGQAHPTAEDVYLIVEVADSTVLSDRLIKAPMYAEAGIGEMWLVNLEKDVIEVYSSPSEGKYQQTRIAARKESLKLPSGLPGEVRVSELLKW